MQNNYPQIDNTMADQLAKVRRMSFNDSTRDVGLYQVLEALNDMLKTMHFTDWTLTTVELSFAQ